MELLERFQMVTIGGPGLGCIEERWDNDCLIHQELCFRANITVLKYSRTELVESSPGAFQAILDFILKVDIC